MGFSNLSAPRMTIN